MKHATPAALDRLEPLLDTVRGFENLREKSRGVFYLKARAVLHFHEDPAGLFADFRTTSADWTRFPVNTAREKTQFIRAITRALIP